MATLVTGAFGCIGAWECKRLIEEAWPAARGIITHAEPPIPFPPELADLGYQGERGPTPRTSIREGIRRKLEEFAALQKAGRLDARELTSAP